MGGKMRGKERRDVAITVFNSTFLKDSVWSLLSGTGLMGQHDGEDENRPGFSCLTCVHFMANDKTKHFIFWLFWPLGGWFSYFPRLKQQ